MAKQLAGSLLMFLVIGGIAMIFSIENDQVDESVRGNFKLFKAIFSAVNFLVFFAGMKLFASGLRDEWFGKEKKAQ